MLRWNALCTVVDFAYWQPNLDKGEPIPMIPRGANPSWNQDITAANAAVVTKSLHDPLWYARILELHLDSMVRSIRRHAANKGNQRRRFLMTKVDEESGTDAFLQREGPSTMDVPFHRDAYYMLEFYMPGRSWSKDRGMWLYVPASQHNTDLEIVLRYARDRRLRLAQEEQLTEIPIKT